MNIPIQHNQNVGKTAGAPPPAAPKSGGSTAPSGDTALLKAMLMQLSEMGFLTNAATAESGLSVALREKMQGKATDTIEEYEQLLEFCTAAENGTAYAKLHDFFNSGQNTIAELQKAFPNFDFSRLPKDTQDDFIKFLYNGVYNGTSTVQDFTAKVVNISPMLNEFGTYQTACKNLADSFQNGAGSLAQSITQFLAQLATESGLMPDAVAQ